MGFESLDDDRRKAAGVLDDRTVDQKQILVMEIFEIRSLVSSLLNDHEDHEDDRSQSQSILDLCKKSQSDNDVVMAKQANDLGSYRAVDGYVYRGTRPLLANDPSLVEYALSPCTCRRHLAKMSMMPAYCRDVDQ